MRYRSADQARFVGTKADLVGRHVPIEVVNRPLAEKPQIADITLPGMPMSSPRMTAKKIKPFKICEIALGSRNVHAVV